MKSKNLQEKLDTVKARQALLQQELYLPSDFPDYQRAIPNGFLRSAMFAALGRTKRPHLTREVIASLNGTSIYYTGVRLTQDDLTLWGNLVHAARNQCLGEICVLSGYEILKMQGVTDTGPNRRVLYRQLAELNATALEIQHDGKSFSGSLIRNFYRDEELDRIVINFEPEIISIFSPAHYTRLDWDLRQKLSSAMAKWLHGFYASHSGPFPYKVETLHRLCGSEAKDVKAFERGTLTKGLKELASVSNSYGNFFNFVIADGLLYVGFDRTPIKLPERESSRRRKQFKPVSDARQRPLY